ncbi:MAG: AbrB/MazE/SpoVT family DNA-binding domain-containing protein [Thermoprotei archaeon]|jgi:bifunctional DNA-binding transcriptional regulator/antitoxin component of YhaV-PrlF toxin-antitoxin module
MREVTILNKATAKSKSLRTTIPIGIVKQFNLSVRDKLNWEIRADDGELIIVVKPVKEHERYEKDPNK